MIPIISIVGKSGSGKTTLLEKLIGELKLRGYRVATVKHNMHDFEIDIPGKDSWRHAQAGSDQVVISSPHKLALIKRLGEEMALDEIAELLRDIDIILTEGYKREDKPKIEVSRQREGGELVSSENELIAIVSDQTFPLRVPQFDLDDAAGVADLLEKEFLGKVK